MANWLTVNPTSGVNNYNLSVTADVNSTLSGRTKYIKVYSTLYGISDYCKVYQDNRIEETISINPTTYEVFNFHSIGEEIPVEITSNGNWTATTTSADITFSTTTGSGNGSVTVILTPNPNTTGTTRIIKFKTQDNVATLTLTQKYPAFIKYKTSDDSASRISGIEEYRDGYWYAFMTNTVQGEHRDDTKITYLELDGVTGLNAYAFAGCNNITTLVMNEGLKYIGNCAFQDVSHLSGVTTIPSTVTGVTSGKWFQNTYIDYLLVKGSLSGSSYRFRYAVDGSYQETGYTSVLGWNVVADTIELASSCTLSQYSLAVYPSTIKIRTGVHTPPPNNVYNQYWMTRYSGGRTDNRYVRNTQSTGFILLDAGMSVSDYEVFKPTSDWTITNAV